MILISCLWLKGKILWFLLSRFISLITILISKVCRVWFVKCIFDFQNLTRLISKIWRVWFPKVCRVWFLKMTLLISKIYRVWFLKYNTFDFQNLSRDAIDFQNLSRLISKMTFWFPKWDRYGWHSRDSYVGGEPYSRQGQGDSKSVVTSRPNEAERVFWWKKGMCPWIGYRVWYWVSSSLF